MRDGNPMSVLELRNVVRTYRQGSREVHVLMNNCRHDYAVRNARQIADRLSGSRRAAAGEGQRRLL